MKRKYHDINEPRKRQLCKKRKWKGETNSLQKFICVSDAVVSGASDDENDYILNHPTIKFISYNKKIDIPSYIN